MPEGTKLQTLQEKTQQEEPVKVPEDPDLQTLQEATLAQENLEVPEENCKAEGIATSKAGKELTRNPIANGEFPYDAL